MMCSLNDWLISYLPVVYSHPSRTHTNKNDMEFLNAFYFVQLERRVINPIMGLGSNHRVGRFTLNKKRWLNMGESVQLENHWVTESHPKDGYEGIIIGSLIMNAHCLGRFREQWGILEEGKEIIGTWAGSIEGGEVYLLSYKVHRSACHLIVVLLTLLAHSTAMIGLQLMALNCVCIIMKYTHYLPALTK
ncbi:hypothetical protein BDB01DRAFT_43145 [Pilobolus umbonatus]|nr:hypothetical protein BDB01DRAFT_43145 [Pilobolus umbonatus]